MIKKTLKSGETVPLRQKSGGAMRGKNILILQSGRISAPKGTKVIYDLNFFRFLALLQYSVKKASH
jgi:hypothetical protein